MKYWTPFPLSVGSHLTLIERFVTLYEKLLTSFSTGWDLLRV